MCVLELAQALDAREQAVGDRIEIVHVPSKRTVRREEQAQDVDGLSRASMSAPQIDTSEVIERARLIGDWRSC
jgi:hypothetical protein